MDHAGWKQLAEEWVVDAKAMLDAGRWWCAYYVAGYAVECALKACVLKFVWESGVIFDDPKFGGLCRTHDLSALMKLANLEGHFGPARGASGRLEVHWGVVKDWTEESRYQRKSEKEARALYEAITDDPDGVLTWIKSRL